MALALQDHEVVFGETGPPGWVEVDPLDVLAECDVSVDGGEQLIRAAFEMGKPCEEIEAVVDMLVATGRGPIRTVSPPSRRKWPMPVGGRQRVMARPRERHAARSSKAGRGSPADSDDPPGESEPPRRRYIVDEHYVVVAVVA